MGFPPMHLPLLLGDTATVLVILALGSILFLTTMLLTMALMLRNRWDEMAGGPRGRHLPRSRRDTRPSRTNRP